MIENFSIESSESLYSDWKSELSKRIQARLRDSDPLAHLSWQEWVAEVFPFTQEYGFGEHQKEAWEWGYRVEKHDSPRPFCAGWARKGGKSATIEMMIVATIVRGRRNYWLYCMETQEQADKQIKNIAHLFQSEGVRKYYPQHSVRSLDMYGHSKGWRRNRLVTDGGGIVDALGLNTAGRGIKFETIVPDGCVLDDFDGKHDTSYTTKKKEETITSTILGACADNVMVMIGQNMIIPNGVMSRLFSGKATYLQKRILSGPIPAIVNLKTKKIFDDDLGRFRDIITGGKPTWKGQGIEACQRLIDTLGLTTFEQEQQHEVDEREGALWTRDEINKTRVNADAVPMDPTGVMAFKRVVVGNDPSGGGDDRGIIIVGLGHDNECYVIADRTTKGSDGPEVWGYETVRAYDEFGADVIAAESNFGGDMVSSNIRVHSENANVKLVPSSRGKALRAEPVKSLYADDRVHHVGSFPELETEMTSWVPGETKSSPNRLDALVFAITELMLQKKPNYGSGRVGEINTRR